MPRRSAHPRASAASTLFVPAPRRHAALQTWRSRASARRARGFSRRAWLPNRSPGALAACSSPRACGAHPPRCWPAPACSRAPLRPQARPRSASTRSASRPRARSTRPPRVGAGWVRTFVRWDQVEPAGPGRWDSAQIGALDELVNGARARNMKVLVVVVGTPSWASGSSDSLVPPRDPADFARFVGAMTARYKGRIAAWEIWNEPDEARVLARPVRPRRIRAAAARRAQRDQGGRPVRARPRRRFDRQQLRLPRGPLRGGRRRRLRRRRVAHRHGVLDRFARSLLPPGRPRRPVQLPRLPRDARRARGARSGRQADLPLGDRLVGDAHRPARAARAPARRRPASARRSRRRSSSSPTAA